MGNYSDNLSLTKLLIIIAIFVAHFNCPYSHYNYLFFVPRNMKQYYLIILFSALFSSLKGQVFSSSNLPIIVITTDIDAVSGKPLEIIDEPRVLANIKIIYRTDGGRNYLSNQNNALLCYFNGRISIELRGTTSQDLPKKPYGLTTLNVDNITNINVPLFGMPKENDWILNSLPYDPTLVRDYLSYGLSLSMNDYAARSIYCELVVNGVYKGLYLFMEKLKVDDNRINITKMLSTDNTGQNLTGGYITKCDKTTGGDPVAWTFTTATFIHDTPNPTEITAPQKSYIYNQFYSLINLSATKNTSITNGYPSIIDIPSFVDFMILNELSSNVDAYQISTYFHKDRNGKLRAGPIWDFNLTFGNDLFSWGFDRSKTNVWQFSNGDNEGAKFWKDLFAEPTFQCYLTKRWLELNAANQPLSYDSIATKIDIAVAKISEATIREKALWGSISNHATEIANLKIWIKNRIAWLNTKFTNCSSCLNVAVPPLVISKIHYNPLTTISAFTDSLEFIEISNNSNNTINLTGIHFRNLGLTYQFPVNAILAANGKIILASNAKSFIANYGFKPFGQFTRNLSNSSEDLLLVDVFGNLIDEVRYTDALPWPIEADGQGSYLILKNLNSDNNVASNWEASNFTLGINNSEVVNSVSLYPIPARNSISIYSPEIEIAYYEVLNLMGAVIVPKTKIESNKSNIDIQQLSPNIYLLKLYFQNGVNTVKKFVKE